MNKIFHGIKILQELLQRAKLAIARPEKSSFQSLLRGRTCNDPMISTKKDLQKMAADAITAGAVGIDTEFVWNRTFYPTLGLVQVG